MKAVQSRGRVVSNARPRRGVPRIVVTPDESAGLTRDEERRLEALSPFELKTNLLEMANAARREHRVLLLDAGRGNPNWMATEPREAFFALGTFALSEARRSWDAPGLAGMPEES